MFHERTQIQRAMPMSSSRMRSVPSTQPLTQFQQIIRWTDDSSWKEEIIGRWKREETWHWDLNMRKDLNRELNHKELKTVPILCVDASPRQGAGILYFPDFNVCYTYKVDFARDLKICTSRDPSIFEMLNLLIAMFVFKSKLVNVTHLRLINDNNKIRNARGNNLVVILHEIFKWLENERSIILVNDPDKNFNLELSPDDLILMRFVDSLSKNKDIEFKSNNGQFLEIEIIALDKEEIDKYRGYF